MRAFCHGELISEIASKLETLDTLWEEVQMGTEARGRGLADTLKISEKFWDELEKCREALSDLKERIEAGDAPACQTDAIHLQQQELQVFICV